MFSLMVSFFLVGVFSKQPVFPLLKTGLSTFRKGLMADMSLKGTKFNKLDFKD